MKHALEELAAVTLDPYLRGPERSRLNEAIRALGDYVESPFARLTEIEVLLMNQGVLVEEKIDRGGITKYREETTRHLYKLYRKDETEIVNSVLVLTVCYVGPRHEVIAYVS